MDSISLALVDPERTAERLSARITVGVGGCLIWNGAVDSCGYGIIATKLVSGGGHRWGWRSSRTHRVAWILDGRQLVEGLVLDHLCRNRRCCNVAHLEQVTQAVNVSRQDFTLPDACPKCGAADWMTQGKQRRCRPCWNDYKREWQRARSVRPTRVCAWCGDTFQPGERRAYCSAECAARRTTLAYRRAHGAAASID